MDYHFPYVAVLTTVIGARVSHFINICIEIEIDRTILSIDLQCSIHWYHSKKLILKFVTKSHSRKEDTSSTNNGMYTYLNENLADLLTISNFQSLAET